MKIAQAQWLLCCVADKDWIPMPLTSTLLIADSNDLDCACAVFVKGSSAKVRESANGSSLPWLTVA